MHNENVCDYKVDVPGIQFAPFAFNKGFTATVDQHEGPMRNDPFFSWGKASLVKICNMRTNCIEETHRLIPLKKEVKTTQTKTKVHAKVEARTGEGLIQIERSNRD